MILTVGAVLIGVALIFNLIACNVSESHPSESIPDLDFRSMTVEECKEGCQAWEVSGTNECNATGDQCVASCTTGTAAEKNACKASCNATRKACRQSWDAYRKECRSQCVPMVCDAPAPPPGVPFLAACVAWETSWTEPNTNGESWMIDEPPTCADACLALNRSPSNECVNADGVPFGVVWSDAYDCAELAAPSAAHPLHVEIVSDPNACIFVDDHGAFQCCCD